MKNDKNENNFKKFHFKILKKMKKHSCIICMKKRKYVHILSPCMHIVCAECLDKCINEYGKRCPICRTDFSETYSQTENGDVVINIKDGNDTVFNGYDYSLPKGNTLWSAYLKKVWNVLPQRAWDLLQNHGISDTVVISYIMSVLSSNPKDKAEALINDFVGSLIPNFFSILFDNINTNFTDNIQADE